MACLIKLKFGEEYYTFDTEQEAKEFIAKNKLDIENSLKVSKKDTDTSIVNIGHSNQERTINTVRVINNVSYDEVGAIRAQMPSEDYDIITYRSLSDAHSMSDFLGGLRNENGDLLFPQYIVENYLNVLKQKALISEYFSAINVNASTEQENELYKKIFEHTITATSEIKLRSAKEWYDYMNSKLSEFNMSIVDLNDKLQNIDDNANQENINNFITMLHGEFMHKIVEYVLHNKKNIRTLIFDPDTGLKNKFIQSYTNYTEVPEAINIINRLFDDGTFNNAFDNYLNVAKNIVKNIKEKYKRADGTYPLITILSEQNMTCDLANNLNGKSKIRGKIDMCVIVDGVLHIYDLKLSKTKHDDWAEAKKLKINYQLSAYKKLAQSLGLKVGTTNVVSVHLNGDIVEYDGIHAHYVNAYGDEQLKKLFKPVKQNFSVGFIENGIQRVHNQMNKLFESGSEIGRTSATIESIAKSLKSKVKFDEKTNTYEVPYYLIQSDGRSKEYHIERRIKADELDAHIKTLAEKIHSNSVSKHNNIMRTMVEDLQSYFNGDIDVQDFKSINSSNPKEKNRINALFSKYKGSNAELVFIEEGLQLGMLFIKSPIGIEVIICSEHDPMNPWDITNKHAKLFDSISDGLKTNVTKSIGAVRIMEAILVLNELNSLDKISDITCIQMNDVKSYKMTTNQLKNYTSFVLNYLHKEDNAEINLNDNSFTDALTKVFYSFNRFLELNTNLKESSARIIPSRLNKLSEDSQQKMRDMFSSKSIGEIKSLSAELSNDDKLIILEALRDNLKSEFSTYFKNIDSTVVNEQTILLYHIELAIAFYKNREFITENDIALHKLSRGAMFASMDLLPEENIQTIHKIVQNDFQKIRDRFASFRMTCKTQVDKLRRENGYTGARQLVVGDTVNNYLNLFRRDDETKELLNGDLIFKNPWTDKSLNKHQIEFLKFVLYTINKYKSDKSHFKWKSHNDVKPEHLNETDFLCPLVRNNGLDRFRDTKGGWNMPLLSSFWYKETWRKLVNASVDVKDTLEGQLKERSEISDTMETMYNEFHSHDNPNIRTSLIANAGGIQAFSLDIELMLQTYVLANDSKEIFDTNTIPTVKSMLYTSLFQSNITGLKLPNFNEFVKKYMKSAVYGDTLIEGEAKEIYKYIGPVKSAAAAIALSYNVMNVPRELLMGFFTNISRAATGAYGKDTFTISDYLKAWIIVGWDIPNFIQNVTKIELLNELYGLSNMSINEIPEQCTTNKTGIFALFGRFSSWSLTAPDYYNRMSMFIAQMIHDGSWDAHELKEIDGVKRLVYNMEADKRFDIYCKYRNTPISEIPENIRQKYNYQAALFEVMYEDFKTESETYVSPKENFVKAYTNKQRNSMKSFADMSFGYYDRDSKAWFFKTSIGVLFKQFMAFLSAKKMSYFQVRSDNTARGSYTQLTDTSGNKIWTIMIDNQILNITDDELNNKYAMYKQYAKPKLVWTGTYMEGIFQSYINLFKDLGIGSYEALMNGNTDILRKVYKEYVKKGDIRHSNILQGLYDLLIATMFVKIIQWIFMDDPDITGISYDKQLKNKSSFFQNAYWIGKSMSQDFNIFTSMYSLFLNWEIPSYNIIQSSVKNFFKSFGDDELNIAEQTLSGTVNSVGMFRWARPYVEELIDE